jgi:hypothetical protein
LDLAPVFFGEVGEGAGEDVEEVAAVLGEEFAERGYEVALCLS